MSQTRRDPVIIKLEVTVVLLALFELLGLLPGAESAGVVGPNFLSPFTNPDLLQSLLVGCWVLVASSLALEP